MPQVTPFVGLDVHAAQTSAGILDPLTGELSRRRLKGDPLVALDFLATLGPRPLAVYEAGPTGFALARAAAERGLDVRVCAPGLIPRKPTDRVKTDARDAERLARLLAAGELSFVRVPSIAEEQLRDLVRAREDLRGDLSRARQRLSHLLRRRGLRYPAPGSAWTGRQRSWLRGLSFEDRASAVTFADYLAGVTALEQRRDAVDEALAELAPDSPWAELIARLRCFRGIDTLAAVGLCAEVGDFGRFSHPRQLGAFLGLVPSERTSDEKRARARSRRPVPSTRAGCSSRQPSTPGVRPASPMCCAGAKPARTRASARSPGAPSGASTANGTSSSIGAASTATSRPSPAPASSPPSSGRPR